ncbi:hypothetical protein VC273_00915 [Xanthomonas nasturtii]|uniref:phosphoribosyltransferase-like protein n=1 Tax=Xanthomonas TaxID=338 RepID=UPI002B22F08B|nr:hypothetical protein [Xanthomonas nasturtii]MEA9554534.1 hypothetical protein [Xanthomonas nasturtii]
MIVPENALQTAQSTHDRTKQLCALNLLPIPSVRLEGWLAQFVTPEERFFASAVLKQLIFRTDSQFDSSIASIFYGELNRACFPEEHDGHLALILRERRDCGICLVPVIRDSDPPTKSGPLVLRRVQKALGLAATHFYWPWVVPVEAKTIIFIDDILGSGTQFIKFLKRWKFQERAGVKLIYAPAVAHEAGIKAVRDEANYVKVITAEKLSGNHGFFSEQVWKRLASNTISAKDAEAWYLDFAAARNLIPSVGALGSGGLALTIGFEHGTPNNSLPLLWYGARGAWVPLLER